MDPHCFIVQVVYLVVGKVFEEQSHRVGGKSQRTPRLVAEPSVTFGLRQLASQRRGSLTDSWWRFSHGKPLCVSPTGVHLPFLGYFQ